MANRNNPHGLRPLCRGLSGGPVENELFQKEASVGTAIFRNDAVVQTASGPYVSATGITPGTTLYSGVALNYGAASTLTDHYVIVDPYAIFEAQDNNSTDGIQATDIGNNANLSLGAGSSTTKLSGHVIDEATIATTSTLDVKLRKILETGDNDYGSYCRVELVFNKHRNAFAVAGV